MTPSWYNSPARLADLRAAALRVEGTPFHANSEAPGAGGGMDCVRLLHFIYRTTGVLPFIEIPRQSMLHGQHSEHSLLIEAFETWPELRRRFAVVPCSPANSYTVADVLPGDALCFIAGKVPHHGGLMLSGDTFLHTLKPAGAHFFHLRAAFRGHSILGELAAVYRPRPEALAS
jgi:hypothetical protein